jgi:hypothetical protein
VETQKDFAKKMANSINYVDLFKDPKDIKIESLWRIYAHNIFNGHKVSAIQYSETKQAFYVGVSEMFRLMSDLSIKFDEDTAASILDRLSTETNDYIDSLIDRTMK